MRKAQKHIQKKDVPLSCNYRGSRYRLSTVWNDERSARSHAANLRGKGWKATYKKIKPKKGSQVYTLPVFAVYTHQY